MFLKHLCLSFLSFCTCAVHARPVNSSELLKKGNIEHSVSVTKKASEVGSCVTAPGISQLSENPGRITAVFHSVAKDDTHYDEALHLPQIRSGPLFGLTPPWEEQFEAMTPANHANAFDAMRRTPREAQENMAVYASVDVSGAIVLDDAWQTIHMAVTQALQNAAQRVPKDVPRLCACKYLHYFLEENASPTPEYILYQLAGYGALLDGHYVQQSSGAYSVDRPCGLALLEGLPTVLQALDVFDALEEIRHDLDVLDTQKQKLHEQVTAQVKEIGAHLIRLT